MTCQYSCSTARTWIKLTPQLQENATHGLAGVHIDKLDIQVQRDALLIIDELTANVLPCNIYVSLTVSKAQRDKQVQKWLTEWTFSSFGCKYTGCLAGEYFLWICIQLVPLVTIVTLSKGRVSSAFKSSAKIT